MKLLLPIAGVMLLAAYVSAQTTVTSAATTAAATTVAPTTAAPISVEPSSRPHCHHRHEHRHRHGRGHGRRGSGEGSSSEEVRGERRRPSFRRGPPQGRRSRGFGRPGTRRAGGRGGRRF